MNDDDEIRYALLLYKDGAVDLDEAVRRIKAARAPASQSPATGLPGLVDEALAIEKEAGTRQGYRSLMQHLGLTDRNARALRDLMDQRAVQPRPAPPTRPKRVGERVTKDAALSLGIANLAATPAKLRAVITEAGYTLPKSATTLENWCKEIKANLAD